MFTYYPESVDGLELCWNVGAGSNSVGLLDHHLVSVTGNMHVPVLILGNSTLGRPAPLPGRGLHRF